MGLFDFIGGMMDNTNTNNTQSGNGPSFSQRFLHGIAAAGEGYGQWEEQQQQITQGGKAADAFRKFLGDNAASVTGIPDAAWDNMSPRDKIGAMGGQLKAEAMKEGMARITDMLSQSGERDALGRRALAQFAANDRYGQAINDMQAPNSAAVNLLTQRAGGMVQDPSMTNALTSLARPQPLSPLENYNLAVRSGVDPERASMMAENLGRLLNQFSPDTSRNVPAFAAVGPNKIPLIYSPRTGQYEIDPAYKLQTAADLKAANTPAEEDPDEGPKTKQVDGVKFYWDTHLKSWKPTGGGGGDDKFSRLMGIIGGSNSNEVAAAATSAAPVKAPAGGNYPTATNKKTGEKMIYKDGKWQTLK